MQPNETDLENIFPACKSLVTRQAWSALVARMGAKPGPEKFPAVISSLSHKLELPEYLAELAELETALYSCLQLRDQVPSSVHQKMINPSLKMLELHWKGLDKVLEGGGDQKIQPASQPELMLVWFDPASGRSRAQPADQRTLTALKIVSEEQPMGSTALEYKVNLAELHRAVDQSASRGLILSPRTRLGRDPEIFQPHAKSFERFMHPRVFTLQWHITQACDLNCKHCYDRSSRSPMPLESAFYVLDELEKFCTGNNVRAKVTFTGGNPLLYPHFDQLYLETVKRGFPVNILGNPASRQRLEQLLAIQTPSMYQVSLEGLRQHNDFVRQPGYFDRVMEFLPLLRELGISSQVMLTLTRDNMDQVLPLGEQLRDMTELFTFNRLSAVGEGASLLMPSYAGYESFLREYVRATRDNPVLGLKDNLINSIRDENGHKPFGGCTGFGCGAGFNFATLLSDGELHACRKFPSPLGNIFQDGLTKAYESEAGRRYRAGSAACRGCRLLPACGGCQAVIYSLGLDPHKDRDPYCFYSKAPAAKWQPG